MWENRVMWNMWHGCHKKSEGCKNCYVDRGDKRYDRDFNTISKTNQFSLPLQKNKYGFYKYKSGTIFDMCFSSDFLIEEADEWRKDIWNIIRERKDCTFFFITKRIERIKNCVPEDWKDGYENVVIGVTAENQKRLEERYPIFLKFPIKHRIFIHEPLLEEIDIFPYLNLNATIEQVCVGGESGTYARECHFDWVLKIRNACMQKNISFYFKQTGAYFVKDQIHYKIARKYQHLQAKKADINFTTIDKDYLL